MVCVRTFTGEGEMQDEVDGANRKIGAYPYARHRLYNTVCGMRKSILMCKICSIHFLSKWVDLRKVVKCEYNSLWDTPVKMVNLKKGIH